VITAVCSNPFRSRLMTAQVENGSGIKLPADPALSVLSPGDLELDNIEGIAIDINELVKRELTGNPLGFEQVGPSWLMEKPGTYAASGVLASEVQARLITITE